MCQVYCESGGKDTDDAAMTYAEAVDCVHTFHQMTLKYMGIDIMDDQTQHIVRLQFDRIIKMLGTKPTDADLLAMSVNEATRDVLFEEFDSDQDPDGR